MSVSLSLSFDAAASSRSSPSMPKLQCLLDISLSAVQPLDPCSPVAAQGHRSPQRAHRHGTEGILVGVHDVGVGKIGGQHRLKNTALACRAGPEPVVRRRRHGQTSACSCSLCRAEHTCPSWTSGHGCRLSQTRPDHTPGAIPASSSGSVVSITFTATVVPFQLPRYTCMVWESEVSHARESEVSHTCLAKENAKKFAFAKKKKIDNILTLPYAPRPISGPSRTSVKAEGIARLKVGMPPATEEMLRWLSMLGRRPAPASANGGDTVPDAGGEGPPEPAIAANGDTACCSEGSSWGTACRCVLADAVGSGGLRVSCRTIAK